MAARDLTVWAPLAGAVDLVLPASERTVPMHAAADGWWTAPAPPAGTDYAFSLDGGQPLPDPRSARQPDGVHGPSRAFDADAFEWTDQQWAGRSARGAVHYELHVGTFTAEGTLDSAIERLTHLVSLGVEMIELMPLAPLDGARGWGYDGVSLYAVYETYGGPEALQRFVSAAHEAGLGVCLDVVYNHLGPVGNYLSQFGPYFSNRHETPWGDGINLDGPDSGPVREYFLGNALRWFRDFHIDALRLDAVHALADDSQTHLLAELAQRTAQLAGQLGRPLSLVAESDLNQPRMVLPVADGGLGMDAQWADDVHHALHTLMTGERHGYYCDFGTLSVLDKALTKVFVHDGEVSTFRGIPWGAPVPSEIPGHAFVVCAQNHDQVGNRALGDRPSRALTVGQLAIEAAVVLAGPYTPMLFMGEEWGARTPFAFFTDFGDPELGEAVRVGRSEEFGSHGWNDLYGAGFEVPDPQARSTFEASKLDWAEASEPAHARLLQFHRDLIRLRREVPDLIDDDRSRTSLEYDEGDPSWFVLHRGGVAIAVNLADEPRLVPLSGSEVARPMLLTWDPVVVEPTGARMTAHSVVVLGPAEV